MLLLLLVVEVDLAWVPPEAVFETSIGEQMVYLESDPRKHMLRREEVRNGRKDANRASMSNLQLASYMPRLNNRHAYNRGSVSSK